MSALVLMTLIAAAFTLQYQLDRRSLRELARREGWSALEMRWAPLALAALLRSRHERTYWLRYRAANGRTERRLAHVGNPLQGAFGVQLAPLADEAGPRNAPAPRPNRALALLVSCCGGAWLGGAVGIGGSLLLFPSSNVAPAYGLILMVPVGLGLGALYGARRARCL